MIELLGVRGKVVELCRASPAIVFTHRRDLIWLNSVFTPNVCACILMLSGWMVNSGNAELEGCTETPFSLPCSSNECFPLELAFAQDCWGRVTLLARMFEGKRSLLIPSQFRLHCCSCKLHLAVSPQREQGGAEGPVHVSLAPSTRQALYISCLTETWKKFDNLPQDHQVIPRHILSTT